MNKVLITSPVLLSNIPKSSFSFFLDFFSFSYHPTMSLQAEMAALSKEDGVSKVTKEVTDTIRLAQQEVSKILQVTSDSLLDICEEMETVSTRQAMESVFKRFNELFEIFLSLDLGPEADQLLREAVCSLKASERFEAIIKKAPTLARGVQSYKATVLKALGATNRRSRLQYKLVGEMDDALFSELLPEPSPPADQPVPRKKRAASLVDNTLEMGTIPKKRKSSIPALASLNFLSNSDDEDGQEECSRDSSAVKSWRR